MEPRGVQEIGGEQPPPLSVRDECRGVSTKGQKRGGCSEGSLPKFSRESQKDAADKHPDNYKASMHQQPAELLAAPHRCDKLAAVRSNCESRSYSLAKVLHDIVAKGNEWEDKPTPIGADNQHAALVAFLDGPKLLEPQFEQLMRKLDAHVAVINSDGQRCPGAAQLACGGDSDGTSPHRPAERKCQP